MSERLVLNGATELRGSLGEISRAHVSEATTLWLLTMVTLPAGETVELQGTFRAAVGYFAAEHTSFGGCIIVCRVACASFRSSAYDSALHRA